MQESSTPTYTPSRDAVALLMVARAFAIAYCLVHGWIDGLVAVGLGSRDSPRALRVDSTLLRDQSPRSAAELFDAIGNTLQAAGTEQFIALLPIGDIDSHISDADLAVDRTEAVSSRLGIFVSTQGEQLLQVFEKPADGFEALAYAQALVSMKPLPSLLDRMVRPVGAAEPGLEDVLAAGAFDAGPYLYAALGLVGKSLHPAPARAQ